MTQYRVSCSGRIGAQPARVYAAIADYRRQLVESNTDGSGVTTFTVDESDGGRSAQVTIATDLAARPGILGLLERLTISIMLPRIYRKELALLASHVARQP